MTSLQPMARPEDLPLEEEGRPIPNQPAPPDDDGPTGGCPTPLDPAMVEAVEKEFSVSGLHAAQLAERLAFRYEQERIGALARRLVRDAQAARDADLDSIEVLTGTELLQRPRLPRQRLLGDLVMVGHNVTITARYKVGKSTLVENIARSLLMGEDFLGRYAVATPQRVALLNYELDAEDMELRVRAMGLDTGALERLLVVNLRGHRLPLMVPAGRDALVSTLLEHRAQVLAVDPFGAAYAAAGGESENDNAEVRRFVTALDEIKRLAGCPSLFMPVHTGRGEQVEGDERGRGATVLDDWADVRMILTKDNAGARFLRTEGRAWDLHESRLGFDEGDNRLMLGTTDVGLDRRKAKALENASVVRDLVKGSPGIVKRELRDNLTGLRKDDRDSAIGAAITGRLVHVHPGPRGAICHYVGGPHEGIDCPEGADLP